MAHTSDKSEITPDHQTIARFFTEKRQIAWVLLGMTMLWGVYGYFMMPKRKDPEYAQRYAVTICPWPGASAERIEQLVTRKIEEKIAQNARVEKIESVSRTSVAVVYVTLNENTRDTAREFDDIRLRLDNIRDLPEGAGPVQFSKDFGETAALMLTVASPRLGEVELSARARSVEQAIIQTRAQSPSVTAQERATLIIGMPLALSPQRSSRASEMLLAYVNELKMSDDPRPMSGPGFIGVDLSGEHDDGEVLEHLQQFVREKLQVTGFQPDVWPPVVIREPDQAQRKLAAIAGDKYSYRELDDYTDLIARTLQTIPQVSRVTRSGVLKETVFLDYSQERLASYGLQPGRIPQLLGARNTTLPGGVLEINDKNLTIDPSGAFKSEKEIGEVLIATTAGGSPVYLRDAAEISRGYENPPRFLNHYTWRDANGQWQRTRAITLAVLMRPQQQIADFGHAIDETLASLRQRLPEDLILARTSDQPLQVAENLSLFLRSLYEAIILVVLVALVGFREWRSALLMALSIPLTLAMTFGLMKLFNLDIQQVSIASLIIALGLLVDDPVVAGDAIKRELAEGKPPRLAAWLGPTKLGRAILYATITNIVAYMPLLLVEGTVGQFIYAIPVVLTCSLIASRIVSMSFIPLLGFYLLRPAKKPEPTLAEMRERGFTGLYYRVGVWALNRRWLVLGSSLVFLAAGLLLLTTLKREFFPKDRAYLSYVDLYLPEDSPLSATGQAAQRAEEVIRETAAQFGREHPGKDGRPREVLESLTTFTGGGGPRFWFSVAPEQQQLNYAQIIIQVRDKRDTAALAAPLQQALSAQVPGARIDVRQLETTKPIGLPVQIRLSGENAQTLREQAELVKAVLRQIPAADRIRDDWGDENFVVNLEVDADRANLTGISNLDVAASSATGVSGLPVTTLREGDKQIPVVVRLRPEERAQLSDIQSLYVYSLQGTNKVPLEQVSQISYRMTTEKIRRRNQFRTITVGCAPVPGVLPSQVMNAAREKLSEIAASLPPGYKLEIGGEEEERKKGFKQLGIVMAVSVLAIYLALVMQFGNAIKPLLVFSAIPFGLVGALIGLALMKAPFGFMAFLGVASLIGVIVSHVIVLFDFVEERREAGAPLREALLDAGLARLRPVFVTVGATIFGLVPLALNGGPLWEPLCYAQIGGLLLANYVTKLLVPALYAIFVEDLKIIRWEREEKTEAMPEAEMVAG